MTTNINQSFAVVITVCYKVSLLNYEGKNHDSQDQLATDHHLNLQHLKNYCTK